MWGGYVPLYLEYVLPAQLTPGNLPAAGGCQYIIFTTLEDRRKIEGQSLFRQLGQVARVSFEWAGDEQSKYKRAAACMRRGIQIANRKNAACVFLCPDMVFADGAFAAVRRLAQNHDVIYVPAIRTLKDAATALSLPMTPRALMKFALGHLHPLAYCSFWSEGGEDFIPANLYWRVAGQGLVARCYHLHPLFVRPQNRIAQFKGTIDATYVDGACPDASRDYVVTDSDELCAIELSDRAQYFRQDTRKGDTRSTALWAQKNATPRHRLLFERTIRMHTGITDEAAWQAVIAQADTITGEIKRHMGG